MPYKDPEVRRQKAREYSRRYYEKNKAALIAGNQKRKERGKERWRAFKATLRCTVCGENHPATLDFHHISPSKSDKKVHKIISNGGFREAHTEIKKCIVLCANCHRKHHWDEHKKKKRGPKPP